MTLSRVVIYNLMNTDSITNTGRKDRYPNSDDTVEKNRFLLTVILTLNLKQESLEVRVSLKTDDVNQNGIKHSTGG